MVRITRTAIPGLLVVDLHLVADPRGWFKEGWQREKMVAAGLPDFGPVQQNFSFNGSAGVTRGFHAEPWDKFVGVASGRIFGAWIDLREGPGFGEIVTVELGLDRAVFVPRGVGNAYQALEDGTCYTYLVNEHWSPEARHGYTFTSLDHPDVAWPIPLSKAVLSDADRTHPPLADVVPVAPRRPLVTGADGQLGRALRRILPGAIFSSRTDLDVADAVAVAAFDFTGVSAIINTAAWTAVDAAETDPRGAWAINAGGPANLVAAARAHRLPLVQISSDYVFDGRQETHAEDEAFSPLSTYGASTAAGDAVVATWERHYILRTSWLVGDGANFVRTMARLADRGESVCVVDDQHGRLTFADDLARAVVHLLDSEAPFGTYHVTSVGETMTWFEVARTVFEARGAVGSVTPISTERYSAVGRRTAARPSHSTLTLGKIRASGFEPADGRATLLRYLEEGQLAGE